MVVSKDYKFSFHGNKSLIIGVLGDNFAVTKPVWGTGLVSIDSMENQAEAESQYADDEVWVTQSGAPLLQGSINFMQLNDDLRTDFFGQQEVSATMGGVSMTGFADTGSYPQRILQYLIEGTAISKIDGSTKAAALLTVYPQAQVTSTPSKSSETDTDSLSVVNWTANIQASATDKFVVNGKKLPAVEFTVVGDEDVAKLKEALKTGKFPLVTTSGV